MRKRLVWLLCLGLALGGVGCGGGIDKGEKTSATSGKDAVKEKGKDASMKDAGLGK